MEELPLILASGSPRRRELLTQAGIPFEVRPADVDETCGLGAREAVAVLSRRKAFAAHDLNPGRTVLAADTLVALDDTPLGKPADAEDAFRMLASLRSRAHHVHTGVCVISPDGTVHEGVDTSEVRFGPVTDEEIRAYIRTGEPMDKAGAYAMQGYAARWIESVSGSPSGIIGLPLCLTCRLLAESGFFRK
ncbi:MAG: Maf family protein [Clostridia bacterium]|nr:Maf family protein [Clostridia bacterium]